MKTYVGKILEVRSEDNVLYGLPAKYFFTKCEPGFYLIVDEIHDLPPSENILYLVILAKYKRRILHFKYLDQLNILE